MLRYFASILSSSKIRRAPKPIVSPLASRIGHSRRPRNRSYADRPWPTSPAATRLLVAEALLAQVTQQRLAVARREADAELLGRRLVEPALAEELARDDGLGRRQLVGVERLGGLVGLDQPLALRPARPVLADVAVLAAQGHAVLVGEPLDGLGEGEPVDLHQEGDDVAALLAARSSGRSRATGVTWNDGDFSSWNGHRPFSEPPPALRSVT